MSFAIFSLQEDYWENFELQPEDIEFLYNHLLEVEIPLTPGELAVVLVGDRIRRERLAIEQRRSAGGDVYVPKETYEKGQELVFPALGWKRGVVIDRRIGKNPNLLPFDVGIVDFGNEIREFAMGFENHVLNSPPELTDDDNFLNPKVVIDVFGKLLTERIQTSLQENDEFVRIAGRWFPRALLVDVNVGHLNLAEAVLDMEGGGPMATAQLLETVDMPSDVNPKLAEFSLDFALWQDNRFDEVGPAGKILWYLRRLEPKEVIEPPLFLKYQPVEHDRELLTEEMMSLELELDDELSPIGDIEGLNDVELRLIYPHWRSGTLPLSARIRSLFPTAYQAPRIRFVCVDGDTGEKFPAWVVQEDRFVYGLSDFYLQKGVMPGSLIHVRRGKNPGEVVVKADTHRATREWVRTVLVGADGGIVLAMLKQMVSTRVDDRMSIAIPELQVLDSVWEKNKRDRTPFERIVVNNLRELSKLTPQGHVHASELYAAVNLVKRCPPAPIFSLLASRPWFVHVGDLHFRFDDSERT